MKKASTHFHLTVAVAAFFNLIVLAAGAGPTPAAAGKGAKPAPLAALRDAAAVVRAARSAPESAAPLKELRDAGAAAFPYLEELIEDEGVHPEVQFYVVDSALQNPSPAAVLLAGRLLAVADPDVRMRAAKLLEQRADGRVADALLAQVARESVPKILASELYALGLIGAKAEPVLVRYLKPDQPPAVQNSAANALGRLRSASQVPKILALIRPENEEWLTDGLLTAARLALGDPGPRKCLAWARDATSPLRLFAVSELVRQQHDPKDPQMEQRLAEVREAARTAFADPSPMVRMQALTAFARAASNGFGYLVDPEPIQRLLEMTRDPAPAVRSAAVMALHPTMVRRGLAVPMPPQPILHAEAMRMLRWPTDWVVLPRLVAMLDDVDPAVRERAAWSLGGATGYWHGYPDIRLQGHPDIDLAAKSGYREMLEQMGERTPVEYTVSRLDRAIRAMVNKENPELHGPWMSAIRVLTGRSFGWRANGPESERGQAVTTLAAWWETNRGKHPAEWIVESLREAGVKDLGDYSLNALGRWSKTAFPVEVFDIEMRMHQPEAVTKRILAWWDASKSELQSASLSR